MLKKIAPLAILVAGCTTTNRFTPTMEADPSEVGTEGLALVTEMMSAYEEIPQDDPNRKLCDLVLPTYQEGQKYSYQRYGQRAGPNKRTEDLFKCWRFKRLKAADSAVEVGRYLRTGFALSDLYCETYFRRIALRWSQRRFARDTTNDLGAAISAVLGLTNVASPITGGIGAAFGLADGAFRNYDEIFVVSPDLPGLQKLVRAERMKLRQSLAKGDEEFPQEYATAFSFIQRYASLCSYVGMKGLLNESMERQSRETSGSGRPAETYTEFMTRKERDAAEIEEARAALAERQKAAAERRALAAKALEDMNKPPEDTEPGKEGEQPPKTEPPKENDESVERDDD